MTGLNRLDYCPASIYFMAVVGMYGLVTVVQILYSEENMYIKLSTVVCIFCLSGCSMQPNVEVTPKYGDFVRYENTGKGRDKLIDNDAVKGFEEYSSQPNNKAFAQSITGSWSWISNTTSTTHAKNGALARCQTFNSTAESLYPCEVININGEWVEK